MLIPERIRQEIGAPKLTELSTNLAAIIMELADWGKLTMYEIGEARSMHIKTIATNMYNLERYGLVKSETDVIDPVRGRKPKVWYLTPTGRILADWLERFTAAVSRL